MERSLLVRIKNKLKLYINPNIKGSHVTNPELLHPSSIIRNSLLNGRILTDAGTIIEDTILIGNISIGRYTSLNGPNSSIYSLHNPVSIGSFCSIASNVTLQEYYHRRDRATSYFILRHIFNEDWKQETESKGKIEIGNDVWIGTHSVILSGVRIGHGAIIGANSVVTKDIPPYAIAVGSPCRVINFRFEPKVIEMLLAIEWWKWDIFKIKRNKEFFSGKMSLEKFNIIVD